jgi:hypothetical protein
MSYAKHSIKPMTFPHDPSLRIADSNNTSAVPRITKNSIACTVLAKYADAGGGEAISDYSAATVGAVFSENAGTIRLMTLAQDARAEPGITINGNAAIALS